MRTCPGPPASHQESILHPSATFLGLSVSTPLTFPGHCAELGGLALTSKSAKSHGEQHTEGTLLRNLWEIDTTAHQSGVSWKKKPKNEAVAQKSMYIRVLLSDGEGMKQLHDGGGRAPPYTHTAQGDRQAASARGGGKKQRMHARP